MAQAQRKAVDLDGLADKMEESKPALALVGAGDPAPTAAQEIAKQICALSSSLHGATVQRLRDLRDRIDDLMRTLQMQDAQFGSIAAHAAQTADQTADAAAIIAESVESLRAQIGQNIAPTITQASGK